jgi:cyclophilin family peptidyl-prolyl cis-trans isomerase
MARASDPNSASSQFYITLSPTPFLDGNYAVFGRVIEGPEGMDVARRIRVGDVMNSVTIVSE